MDSKILKKNPLSYTISCLLAASSFNVLAQEPDADKAVEKIEITGTRILREGAIAPSPVTVISGEDLLKTGAISIGEALNDLPSLANTFSLANAGNTIGTAGLNLLDLRGMGTARTLVLVDGKRHVSANPGTASVDVNTIPTAWVERVEIITGGASAVYGADAVTGVVNFVLKKDITGLDVSVTKSYAEEGPYDNDKVTISFGTDFDEGRGNIGFAISHDRQDGMNAKDRKQTSFPVAEVSNPANGDSRNPDGTVNHDGIPDRIFVPGAAWYDDSVGGNFYAYDYNTNEYNWYIFNPDGSVRPQRLGTTYNWGRCSGECDILDLTRYSELQPTFSTLNVSTKANYDITPDMNIYGEAKFVRTKADSIGQPSFFEYGSGITINRDNPYVDESLGGVMDYLGLSSINLHRFNEDIGRRFEENTRETTRFVGGIKGSFGDDWSYDVYGLYGKSEREQVNLDNVITDRMRQSADAIRLADGSIGCRDEAARAAGCVPSTFFGEGNVNPLAADWFTTDSFSQSKIQQTVFNASVSNSGIFELPAGYVGVAAGYEFRKEKSDDWPDPFAATGATFLTAIQEEHGEFDVNEVFAEASVPLLTDLPLVQDLVLDLAARYADYSTIGGALSWKVGFDWTVNDELRVRSTVSEAIRAPNISELFAAKGQNFDHVDDPCDVNFNQSATRLANCAAQGIPSDAVINPVSSTELLTGGNPDLKEEESTSYTLGLVYQPSFVENLVFTIDYWDITIDDAIDLVDAQDILDKCYDSIGGVNNQFCALITRGPDYKLTLVESTQQNVAKQEAKGIDFEVGYDFDALGGDFTTQLIGTYLKSRKEFPFQIEPEQFIENAGTTDSAKWQANMLIGYTNGPWSANWRTRYLDKVNRFTPQDLETNPDRSDIMGYGSYFQTDVRAGYQFENNLTLEVGVDNVFDRDLPHYTNGTGDFTAGYDNIGRLYYMALTYSFK
ncbi:TonB-dependent receptor [Aliiglaciecola sp. CAU 1673]|uniref:TonB-dependent receptor n=1 Tax=Aliiglaciecola sp. CAU 1673 TaxID=3032595 RepID=UPI0023DBCE35|nr:TonB-dependent receptor [Aliiglaciecola sp. CAU 1673]MDF2178541.1 TonB-dependent receptor [Aliiglaciecola sp. CAU 1673]